MFAMSPRILIVEDDPDISELVAHYLGKAINFATDSGGRITSIKDAAGRSVSFTYHGDGRLAQRLVPWSPDPWRLHGEALLSTGNVKAARRDFRQALAKDPADWESWADLALVTEGAERRDALVHARRLNPLG